MSQWAPPSAASVAPVPAVSSAIQAVPSISAVPAVPAISAVPTIPVGNPEFMPSQGPPPIQVLESESEDDDVQTVTIPFNSASSSTFLPMISVEDRWSTELEFSCLLYTSPSPRDRQKSRMPSSA